MSDCGGDCIKNDYLESKGQEKADNKWQTWGVRILFVALIAGNGAYGWVAIASSSKDSVQDSRLTAVETNQANTTNQINSMHADLKKLIDLSNKTNILIQTHIAEGR